jgi:hypothetical protein
MKSPLFGVVGGTIGTSAPETGPFPSDFLTVTEAHLDWFALGSGFMMARAAQQQIESGGSEKVLI